MDVLSFAVAYVSAGGGRLAAARLLRAKYESFDAQTESDGWLRRATLDDKGGLFACFFQTWERDALETKKYGRGRE